MSGHQHDDIGCAALLAKFIVNVGMACLFGAIIGYFIRESAKTTFADGIPVRLVGSAQPCACPLADAGIDAAGR